MKLLSVALCASIIAMSSSVAIAGKPGSSTPTPVASPYKLIRGDFHSHTDYSDGTQGTPATAYAMAKAAGAGFYATTDHNYMIKDEEWAATLQEAAAATTSSFVAIAASEYWVASGFGEVLIYNTTNDYLENQGKFQTGQGTQVSNAELGGFIYNWINEKGGIGAWPHPTKYGDQAKFTGWTPTNDRVMAGLEIHNYAYVPSGIHDFEPSFIEVLDKGWHVMPMANSDTHYGGWYRDQPIRTALYATGTTKAAVFEALMARRGYAALDTNLVVAYSLNNAIMGSNLNTPNATSFTANIQVSDPDNIASDNILKVELVSNGGQVVASINTNSTNVTWSPTVTSSTSNYYYVRVTTASDSASNEAPGVTAWTAPVWTGRVAPVYTGG